MTKDTGPSGDVEDPQLRGTADLLRGLRTAPLPPPPAVSREVLEQVKPLAARRRYLMLALLLGAALAAVGYVVMLATSMAE